jgi:hypothetical protein
VRRAGAGLYNFLPATGLQIGPTFTPSKLDFAPRSGLAWWAPFRSGNWVVRGGFGVFYDVPSVSEFTVSGSTSNRGASGLAYNPAGPNADLHALGQECVSCSGCADFRFGCGYAAVRRLLGQPELLTCRT